MTHFLYRKPVRDFVADVQARTIAAELVAEATRSPYAVGSGSEVLSWEMSLPALGAVLEREPLYSSDIFVEVFMPLTSARCDVLLTGRDEEGQANAVVLELKQWSTVQPGIYPDHVSLGSRPHLHPSAQARDYVAHLRGFNSAFAEHPRDPVQLHGAAYLHNMSAPRQLALLRNPATYGDLTSHFPVFGKDDSDRLALWLEKLLTPGPGGDIGARIERGEPVPAPKLLDLVVQTINGDSEWNLLDEQRTVFFAIRHAVQQARDREDKRVLVVRGGPGTGKSVIAIQLLAAAARQHWKVIHATGSQAFQTVLKGRTLKMADELMKRIYNVRYKKQLPVDELFTRFSSVAQAGAGRENAFDLVVADEAHRLWTHRRIKFPNGRIKLLSDTPMIEEVIRSARVSAFFLDDNQSVRPDEIGHSSVIREAAERMGIPCDTFDLNLQFRCNGSSSYVSWVDGLLQFDEGNDLDWLRHGGYRVRLHESMGALAEELLHFQRTTGRLARLVAAYCWRWSSPINGQQPCDLDDPRFGGWKGRWIEKSEQQLKPLDHRYYHWATNPDMIDHVGSIYSVQGFEFDRVGVIWGEDLVWRKDRWVAQLEHCKDPGLKRELQRTGADPLDLLRNTYRVLLTRGMTSTELFILDEETRAHVRSRATLNVQRGIA